MDTARLPIILALALSAVVGVLLVTVLKARKPEWVRPLSGLAYALVVYPIMLVMFSHLTWTIAAVSAAIGVLLWWKDPCYRRNTPETGPDPGV